VLTGTGDADGVYTGVVPGFGQVQLAGTAEVTRADVEGLIRFRIPSVNAYVYTGARSVRYDEEGTTPLAPGQRITIDNELIFIEFGAGAFVNLDDAARHRVFGNLTTGVALLNMQYRNSLTGRTFSREETDPILDANIGYQWLINDWFSFNLRYRAFALLADDLLGFSGVILMHGPEFGAAFHF